MGEQRLMYQEREAGLVFISNQISVANLLWKGWAQRVCSSVNQTPIDDFNSFRKCLSAMWKGVSRALQQASPCTIK